MANGIKRHLNDDTAPRDLRTVKQFSKLFPDWSEASLRCLIISAPDNGLAAAIYRDRRRVLISESGFFQWIAAQQKRTA